MSRQTGNFQAGRVTNRAESISDGGRTPSRSSYSYWSFTEFQAGYPTFGKRWFGTYSWFGTGAWEVVT